MFPGLQGCAECSIREMAMDTPLVLSRVGGLPRVLHLSGPDGVVRAAVAAFHTSESLNVFKPKVSILSDSSSRKSLEPVVLKKKIKNLVHWSVSTAKKYSHKSAS